MTPLSPVLLLAALNAMAAERQGGLAAIRVALAFGRKVPCQLELASDDLSLGSPYQPAELDLIHILGFWAHYDHRCGLSSWPMPIVTSAEHLEQFAEEQRVLVNTPQMGDIYIAAGRDPRPARQVGIVTQVELSVPIPGQPAAMCVTARGIRVPGVTDAGPSIGVVFAKRFLTTSRGDRFIRWADLDWRQAIAKRAAA